VTPFAEIATMPDLADDLGHDEHDALEFKESLADRDVIRKAICALSNDLPERGFGDLLIGVDDDGRPVGLNVDDELLKSITEFRNDGRILPRPVIAVQRVEYDGVDCVQVRVTPSASPPVRFDGVVYVRIGPTTRRAFPEDERILSERRRAGDLPFDVRAVESSTIDHDLDLELFQSTYLPAAVASDVLDENQRNVPEQLASLRLATPDGVPTVLGMLVLGLDPASWLPGAYVQFVRYQGTDEDSPITDEEQLGGNMIGQLRDLDRLLPVNVKTAVREATSLQETEHPDYPLGALREAVVNALVHRSYETRSPVRILWFDDRVEIVNAGGPYGAVTPENFERLNDYRNPALAEAAKNLGFVNRFGRGISRIRTALEKNGNPEPEFMIEATYWGVIIRAARHD
jgi:ATP-dependent DNA helicase RecG